MIILPYISGSPYFKHIHTHTDDFPSTHYLAAASSSVNKYLLKNLPRLSLPITVKIGISFVCMLLFLSKVF